MSVAVPRISEMAALVRVRSDHPIRFLFCLIENRNAPKPPSGPLGAPETRGPRPEKRPRPDLRGASKPARLERPCRLGANTFPGGSQKPRPSLAGRLVIRSKFISRRLVGLSAVMAFILKSQAAGRTASLASGVGVHSSVPLKSRHAFPVPLAII